MSTYIHDRIHKSIILTDLAKSIINTKEYQRLRRISQTGILFFIFPCANHTRFEHSIGVYHLAKKMCINLINPLELNRKFEIIELVGIAGLCHDLGHVAFSHLFDEFAKKYKTFISHEERSVNILKHIINKYKIDITEEEYHFICNLIIPPSNYEKGIKLYNQHLGKWIFQIVANPINGIDVDKFDYLVRDSTICGIKTNFDFDRIINQSKIINDEVVFPYKLRNDIFQMFLTRYQLHQNIYNHKKVKAIEILIVKILERIEKIEPFMYQFNQIKNICNLIDDIIFTKQDNIINQLLENIYQRNFPKLDKILTNLNEKEDYSKYTICKINLGFSNDNTNPLLNILYFEKNNKLVKPSITDYGLLANINHKETLYYLYLVK